MVTEAGPEPSPGFKTKGISRDFSRVIATYVRRMIFFTLTGMYGHTNLYIFTLLQQFAWTYDYEF